MPSGGTARRPADFVILSAMRSGSNNLQDALNAHPEIDCGGEIFNPSHLQVWGRSYQSQGGQAWTSRMVLAPVIERARYWKRRQPRVIVRLARRPWGRRLFGFRLFGDHITYFGLVPFVEELHAQGVRLIHLVRRDTFAQAVSLVRAQITGVWQITEPGAITPPVDLGPLAARVEAAMRTLHEHKTVTSRIARRLGAMPLDYDEYTRDAGAYDRIQAFLGVRARVPLGHANWPTPPPDPAGYARLREEIRARGAAMEFAPDEVEEGSAPAPPA